jgi:hypothetical protein
MLNSTASGVYVNATHDCIAVPGLVKNSIGIKVQRRKANRRLHLRFPGSGSSLENGP